MGAYIDSLATPGSQYGYTGNPVDYTSIMRNWAAPSYASPNYGITSAMPNNMGLGADGTGIRVPNMPVSSVFNTGMAGAGPAAPATPAPGWVQNMRDWGMLGSTDKNGIYQQGWGGLALGAAQGLGGLYLGMQQYSLAKDALENSKAQFERNYAAQKATTNANLEDRQRARVASNGGAYQSVGDYMAQNGIK